MWGVSKSPAQNVHSETEQGHPSHVLLTLASKTNSRSPCLWPSLRYILPPPHFFAPDVTGNDLPTDGEVTGSHMRLMIKSPISLPFCFVFDQRQFPTLWLGTLVFGVGSHMRLLLIGWPTISPLYTELLNVLIKKTKRCNELKVTIFFHV